MEVADKVVARRPTESHAVFQNSLVLLARYVILAGLNATLLLFLPRYLGDRGLGQLQFANAFVSLLSIGVALGVRQFLIKEVARDRTQVRVYLGTALSMRLITGFLTFVGIVLTMQLLGFSGEAAWVVYFAAATMVALAVANVMASVLHGLENMSWPALSEVANKLLVMVVGIGVLVQGFGVVAYAGVLLAGALVQLLLSLAYVHRSFPIRLSFQPRIAKVLLMGGAPFLLMEVLLNVYRHVDTVMLRFMTAEEVVGWYAAASQLYGTVQFLTIALTTAMLPTLARAHVDNIQALVSIAKKSIAVTVIVITPMALGLSLLSDEVLDTLPYPEVFRNSVPLLRVLALSIPISALLTIFGTIAVATDRQKIWSIALLGTVAFNVVLNFMAIPYFQETRGNGAIGAAFTTLACESAMVLIGARLMPKGVVDRSFVALLLKVALAGGVMLIIGYWMKGAGWGIPSLIAASAVIYGSLILATQAVAFRDLKAVKDALYRPLNSTRNPRNREGGRRK